MKDIRFAYLNNGKIEFHFVDPEEKILKDTTDDFTQLVQRILFLMFTEKGSIIGHEDVGSDLVTFLGRAKIGTEKDLWKVQIGLIIKDIEDQIKNDEVGYSLDGTLDKLTISKLEMDNETKAIKLSLLVETASGKKAYIRV